MGTEGNITGGASTRVIPGDDRMSGRRGFASLQEPHKCRLVSCPLSLPDTGARGQWVATKAEGDSGATDVARRWSSVSPS